MSWLEHFFPAMHIFKPPSQGNTLPHKRDMSHAQARPRYSRQLFPSHIDHNKTVSEERRSLTTLKAVSVYSYYHTPNHRALDTS